MFHLIVCITVLKNNISLLFGHVSIKLYFSSLNFQTQPHPEVNRYLKMNELCYKSQVEILLRKGRENKYILK